MKFHFTLGALAVCALPALAQPVAKPANVFPFPLVSPPDAARAASKMANGEQAAPKIIALRLDDVTLNEAVKELSRQSGTLFSLAYSNLDSEVVERLSARKLSVAVETPWASEAMRAIAQAAKVNARLQVSQGDDRVQALITGEQTAPQAGVGPFQIQLTRLDLLDSQSVLLGDNAAILPPPAQSLTATFGWTSDPQLKIEGTPLLRLTRAEDEVGRSLLVAQDARAASAPTLSESDRIQLDLKMPDAGAQQLAHLEGVATYVLPTKTESWQVPDLLGAANPQHDFGSNGETISVKVVRAAREGARLLLEMEVTSSRPAVAGELRNPLISSDVIVSALRLRQAGGREFRLTSASTSSGAQGTATINAEFSLRDAEVAPGAVSLALEVPVEWVQTEVPFAFENVPLP